MPEELASRSVPPYASFATLLHQLERMDREGVPGRIDKTYLVGMAGGTQNQLRHAMRSLGLIAEDGQTPTQTLIDLAKRPDERPQLLASILRERFPTLVGLGQDATKGQLDEALGAYQLNGATARKAATFFVSAATYAGIPLSPHIKPKAGPGTSAPRRPVRRKRNAGQNDGLPIQQDGTPSDKDRMLREYFELLVEKAKKVEKPDSELLNRIERVIGIEVREDGKSSKGRSRAGVRSDARVQTDAEPDGSKPEG
jgi:hypothetical protein